MYTKKGISVHWYNHKLRNLHENWSKIKYVITEGQADEE